MKFVHLWYAGAAMIALVVVSSTLLGFDVDGLFSMVAVALLVILIVAVLFEWRTRSKRFRGK